LEHSLQKMTAATNEKQLHHLSLELQKNVGTPTAIELKTIEKILQANLYAKLKDHVNHNSDLKYKEAINQLEGTKNQALQVWVNTQVGFYYYSYGQYLKALPYFLASSRILDQPTKLNLLDGCEVLKKNAYFFGTIKEYDKSISYLKTALKLSDPTSENYAALLNSIGNIYLAQNSLTLAEDYFTQTKKQANIHKHEVRYAKALGDIARVHIKQKKWLSAEALLLEDIALSEKNKSDRNIMFAKIQLGDLYLEKGDLEKAKSTLLQTRQYIASKNYLQSFDQEITTLLLEIAARQHDGTTELFLRKRLDTLKQQLATTDGDEAIKQMTWQIAKEKVQWQLEAEQAKVEKVAYEKWGLTLLCLTLILFVILVFIIYSHKLKLQKNQYNSNLIVFERDKIQSEKKLSEAQNSLTSYKVYLSEKNSQIANLENALNKTKHSSVASIEAKTGGIQQLLNSHLMTDQNWLLFKKAFINEQSDYYHQLMMHFPNLTESNLRILLLQKAGLNNQETANILGVTLDAVKKAKQRLRKKYPNTFDII